MGLPLPDLMRVGEPCMRCVVTQFPLVAEQCSAPCFFPMDGSFCPEVP
jgi:hypothetical protein